jgi:hypothetical protein
LPTGRKAGGFSTLSFFANVRPGLKLKLSLPVGLHVQGSRLEAYAATLREEAVHLPAVQLLRRTGQELIDACAKVRGLLTDEEVDTLFRRNPSFARPVDFE